MKKENAKTLIEDRMAKQGYARTGHWAWVENEHEVALMEAWFTSGDERPGLLVVAYLGANSPGAEIYAYRETFSLEKFLGGQDTTAILAAFKQHPEWGAVFLFSDHTVEGPGYEPPSTDADAWRELAKANFEKREYPALVTRGEFFK